ncbi:MAG: sodium:calcium antiporter, partial [Actinomycetia bacterium]|nr:sodium:calcium antiporter [Actinomycetes bacterium]
RGRSRLLIDIIRVLAGLVILIVAADRLVLSAVRIAKTLNVSTIIIGAVIVGFGTSVPEFVVSSVASSQGNLDLALSNVVASNTSNITLVLGTAAMIAAISTKHAVIKREGVLMFVAVSGLAVVLLAQSVTRIEGVVLVVGMAAAIWALVRWGKQSANEEADGELDEIEADPDRLWIEVIYGVASLIATVAAGHQLLLGVESIGSAIGLSVVFMGLITGVGTSLPELSAAIAASRRKQSDLVLGNVLGSNVFNSLGVAGLAIIVRPGTLTALSPLLVGMMVATALFAGIFAATAQRITRLEGLVLVVMFLVYAAMSL